MAASSSFPVTHIVQWQFKIDIFISTITITSWDAHTRHHTVGFNHDPSIPYLSRVQVPGRTNGADQTRAWQPGAYIAAR